VVTKKDAGLSVPDLAGAFDPPLLVDPSVGDPRR
jgi:hypothetical protein